LRRVFLATYASLDGVAEEVARLKHQRGQDILVYGSADLVHTLMQHDL
jgi:hypothetical protein